MHRVDRFWFQKNAASLLYVAEKYNVDVATHLEDILQKRMTTSNALTFLSISYKFNLKNLKTTALAHVQKHLLSQDVDEQMKVSYFLFFFYISLPTLAHEGYLIKVRNLYRERQLIFRLQHFHICSWPNCRQLSKSREHLCRQIRYIICIVKIYSIHACSKRSSVQKKSKWNCMLVQARL